MGFFGVSFEDASVYFEVDRSVTSNDNTILPLCISTWNLLNLLCSLYRSSELLLIEYHL